VVVVVEVVVVVLVVVVVVKPVKGRVVTSRTRWAEKSIPVATDPETSV
jgi:hypothetical protein